ncbi:MAG: acyl-CoA carboxylase subunit epsilon [Kibdelosporangium sp.]
MSRPDLIVLRGTPADDELAALIAVLASIDAKAAAEPAQVSGPAGVRWSSGPGRPAYRPPGAWTPLRARRSA